jgi:hypothetical protein
MIDANLLLRSDSEAALSASEQARAAVDFGGADVRPITYLVVVPSVTGTAATCDIKVQDADATGGPWYDFLTFLQIVQASAVGTYRRTGVSKRRYRRAYITLGGTTPNFGTTLIAPTVTGDGLDL